MKRILLLAGLILLPLLALSSSPALAEGTGSITIVERARCEFSSVFNGCGVTFFYETRGSGLSDFALDAARSNRSYNQEEFTGLAAGIYRVTQTDNDGWPLTSIYCTSDGGRRGGNFTYGGTYARIDLRDGEDVQCEFSNSPATPTPSPTSTPTPQPTATLTPLSTATPSPAVPVLPPQILVACADGSIVSLPNACPVIRAAATAVVAPPVVNISPPRTGDAGLLPVD